MSVKKRAARRAISDSNRERTQRHAEAHLRGEYAKWRLSFAERALVRLRKAQDAEPAQRRYIVVNGERFYTDTP